MDRQTCSKCGKGHARKENVAQVIKLKLLTTSNNANQVIYADRIRTCTFHRITTATIRVHLSCETNSDIHLSINHRIGHEDICLEDPGNNLRSIIETINSNPNDHISNNTNRLEEYTQLRDQNEPIKRGNNHIVNQHSHRDKLTCQVAKP